MNTTIITNQMLILIGSTGSPPYCLVPPVRSADVDNASPQASARIMPDRLEGVNAFGPTSPHRLRHEVCLFGLGSQPAEHFVLLFQVALYLQALV